MIFGKYINRYYFKHALLLLVGLAALVVVDYFQLLVPELFRMVINGINTGSVQTEGGAVSFDLDFLLMKICVPMIVIILVMVAGRFLWRVCFFGAAIKTETDLRDRMFLRCKDLSQSFYQENKVAISCRCSPTIWKRCTNALPGDLWNCSTRRFWADLR